MKRRSALLLLTVSLVLSAGFAFAGSGDSVKAKLSYPNNIKLNISAPILYSPAFVFSYERTVKPLQTFSVIAGYVTFPQIIGSLPDSINLVENKSKSGFRVGGDYRFYFRSENKYDAPRGLYWAPFFDYYHFLNKRTITVTDTSFAKGELTGTFGLDLAQVGVSMGYQFVIKKRLSIDLALFGPALAYYSASIKLDGNLDINQENEYLQALYDFLINSFPVLGDLANGQEVDSNGFADFMFAGFRYSIWVGFRF
jgi:hypothetical protein